MAGTQTHLYLAQRRAIAVGLLVAALALSLGLATAQANAERSPDLARTAATGAKKKRWQAPPGAVKLPVRNFKKVGKLTCGRVKGSWRPGLRLRKRWFLDYRRASKNATRQAVRLSRRAKAFRKLGKAAKAKRVTRQARKLRRKAKRLGKNYRKRVRICRGSTASAPAGPLDKEPFETSRCFSNPASCGYPAPSNTGTSGTLTPSGSITASTAGATIKNLDVMGDINVIADSVTIENVRVTQTDDCGPTNACGNYAIRINEGVSGTVIRNVETRTESGKTCEHDIRNTSEVGELVIEGSYLHACDSNVYTRGPTTLKDSYGLSKIDISTDHVENIYFDDTSFTAIHDTLLNPVDQTAVIFGNVNGGSGGPCQNHLTIEDSLLAGGGFTIYSCGNGTSAGSSSFVARDNHFARCLGAEVSGGGGQWVCKGGADSNGYYPNSGSYGVVYPFSGPLTWSANVWDDNLAPAEP